MAASTSVLTSPAVDINRQQSPDQMTLCNDVRALWDEAKRKRQPVIALWRFYHELLTNENWRPGQSAWAKPNTDMPEMWPIVAALVAWMTDQRPRFQCSPAADPFSPYAGFMSRLAQDLKTVLDANWSNYTQDAEIEKMLWDAHSYGIGFLKSVWDNTLEEGQGNAVNRRLDPFTFYWDPRATSMEDSNYFLEVRTFSLQELDRRWPGSAKKLMGATWDENVDEAPRSLDGMFMSPLVTNPYSIQGGSATELIGTGKDARQLLLDRGVTVIEAWLREHKVVNGKVIDGWRCVCITGNHVLMDEPAKNIWNHGQHPYQRYVMIETGDFLGKGVVELIAPAQLELNFLLSALGINVRLIGNPVLLEDEGANTQRTRMAARPGQRLSKRQGSEVKYLIPPELHPQMTQTLIEYYTGRMDYISGMSAVKGMMPGGRNSADVFESVQDAGFVRIRLAMRNLERTLTKAGQLTGSLICQFYDEDRIVAITGPGGQQSALALHASHFYVPSKKGRNPLKFSLIIDAGSSLPTSKRARVAEMDTLFAMGALDVPALLEAHEVPNRDAIWARISELMASGNFHPPGARQRTKRS